MGNLAGFGYSTYRTTKVATKDGKDIYAPCVDAGYGPYFSRNEGINAIAAMFIRTASEDSTGYLGEGSSDIALSQKGAQALQAMIAAGSGNGITGVYYKEVSNENSLVTTIEQVNPDTQETEIVSTGNAVIPIASTDVYGLVKLNYTETENAPADYKVQSGGSNSSLFVRVPNYNKVSVYQNPDSSSPISYTASNSKGGNELTLKAGNNVTLSVENNSVKFNAAGGVPSDFIEVFEPGLYNVDLNFTPEPVAGEVNNFGISDRVMKDIQRIKNILGDMWNDEIGDFTFKFEEE